MAEGGDDRPTLDTMSVRCRDLPGRAGLREAGRSDPELGEKTGLVTETQRPVSVRPGIKAVTGGDLSGVCEEKQAEGQAWEKVGGREVAEARYSQGGRRTNQERRYSRDTLRAGRTLRRVSLVIYVFTEEKGANSQVIK